MRRRNRKGGEKRRRTTIEISTDHGKRLREIAAERGERGFSRIIGEALDRYLSAEDAERKNREELLALEGSITHEEAEEMRANVRQFREGWRRR